MTEQTKTFTSSEGGGDFELPDEGIYTFQLTKMHEPRTGPNIFWKEGDPESKREQTSMMVDLTVMFDEDWGGTLVRQYWNPTMGTSKFPSTLRKFAAAILGMPVGECDDASEAILVDGYFQATLTHKEKKNGDLKAVVSSPVAYKRKGNKKPPPPPVEEEFDAEADFGEQDVA